MDSELLNRLNNLSDNDNITVSVWIQDISKDKILSKIKNNPKLTHIVDDNMSFVGKTIEDLDLYTMAKRNASKEIYKELHKQFKIKIPKEANVIFTSNYSPLLIVELTKKDIEKLSKDKDVLMIEYYDPNNHVTLEDNNSNPYELTPEQIQEIMSTNLKSINADYTKNTMGLDGYGVKVGIVETHSPNQNHTEIQHLNITTHSLGYTPPNEEVGITHATRVASIIAGENVGIAPNVQLYYSQAYEFYEQYEAIEWLLDQGVNVINMSLGNDESCGKYDRYTMWFEHIAIKHDVHFVKSAGNLNCIKDNSGYYNDLDGNNKFDPLIDTVKEGRHYITGPGMAYNLYTIGAFNNKLTSEFYDDVFGVSVDTPNQSTGQLVEYSAHDEYNAGTSFKPDLTSPGLISTDGVHTGEGTSFSAAYVTGVIAQLIESEPTLATKQSVVKSILASGTGNHRTSLDYGEEYWYDTNKNTLRRQLTSSYYSDNEGAGVIDAKESFLISANHKYKSLVLTPTDFPYETTIYIDKSSQPVSRVSIAWLKQININDDHDVNSITNKPLSDFDLEIYGPDGNFVRGSTSMNNNVEIVEFIPNVSGNYKVKISHYCPMPDYCTINPNEYIGLSWW